MARGVFSLRIPGMYPVTNEHIKSVQLVALQNQLLLAIGGTLDAREAMLSFMRLALKQLDLNRAHIYLFDDRNKHLPFGKDRIILSTIRIHLQLFLIAL